MEQHDRDLLEDPQTHILEPGGEILLYKDAAEGIVATMAFIPTEEGVYELGKMAVDKAHRGRGIGQELMRFGLNFARERRWKGLVLYSNRKLENSLHIYRKYGFQEIEMEADNPYSRGDIKMALKM